MCHLLKDLVQSKQIIDEVVVGGVKLMIRQGAGGVDGEMWFMY